MLRTAILGLALAAVLLASSASHTLAQPTQDTRDTAPVHEGVAAKFQRLQAQLPAPVHHYDSATESLVLAGAGAQRLHEELLQAKLTETWFAALAQLEPASARGIAARFATWRELVEFIEDRQALLEVWAYGEGGLNQARRLTASELAHLREQPREFPTFVTLTYPDPGSSELLRYRIEFGFSAARTVLAAHQGYRRHRQMQIVVHEILGARDGDGRLNAQNQWDRLQSALSAGELELLERPARPAHPRELLVAAEYEVDAHNNYLRVLRFYRETEIQRRVTQDTQGSPAGFLALKKSGERQNREAHAYAIRGVSDELVPMPNPILGLDAVELRIQDPNQSDVRRWNVLEFGEPEAVKQSALAQFSLLNAHLEKRRKEIAVRKSKYDLIAEPLIAGLNVGGGLAGAGFPLGDAGRLLYNLISTRLIADVPTVKEMRDLFAVMAARDLDPELRGKPAEFLSSEDIEKLSRAGRKLTDAQVQEYLERISDEDLRGMLRLARLGMFDARITNFLNLLTSAGKISGETEEPGLLRDIFNSVYFSVNGDINLKTILAVVLGGRVLTPLSGVSLENLAKGEGPARAWAQFFELSVDVRAVLNTLARLSKRTLAKKELEKPFPYAPRMTDLAAYEIRAFGFPLLILYKRGLLKEDQEAFLNDYAYGLIGAKLVEHFATKEEMDREIRAGRMIPLGYVRVWGGKGWKETNLAVFAHRISQGRYAGKTSVIIYGLKAYQEHSDLVEREWNRFRQFEQALMEGAVIEQLVEAPDASLPSKAFEPVIHLGEQASSERFSSLLSGLLEWRRYWQLKQWGRTLPTNELHHVAGILEEFGSRGVWLDDADSLAGVDQHQSAFIYRQRVEGKLRTTKVTRITGLAQIDRTLRKREEDERVENLRRQAATGEAAAVVLLNEARLVNGRFEVGPLLADNQGHVVGRGVRTGTAEVQAMLQFLEQLPVLDRARLKFNHYAATLIDLDADGDGTREKVFLTIEFPAGREVRREWLNPLSGETEIQTYRSGLWRESATARRVVVLEYDEHLREVATKTYSNRGSLEAPVRGALLEETRTIATWFRDLNRPEIDPTAPIISKLRFNHITGQISREDYSLFPLPVLVVEEPFITVNRYNDYGLFLSASVFRNEGSDPGPNPLQKLLEPVRGLERFALAATSPEMERLHHLEPLGFQLAVQQQDLLKGLSKTLVFDNARDGRKIREQYRDTLEDGAAFEMTTALQYRDDFHAGLIPFQTSTRSSSDALLSAAKTTQYDPETRRLVAVVTDHAGHVTTNTWDYRWETPVESRTATRATVRQFDDDEMNVSGTTVLAANGETIARFQGQYDAGARAWNITQAWLFRPDIPLRTETNTFSGFGRLVRSRVGEHFETRPVYDANGIEAGRRVYRRDPQTGRFDLLHREEDEYRWIESEREARVRTYVNGERHDEFRIITDRDGRLRVDAIRQFPGLELRTVLDYDGGSERLSRSVELQNGQVRLTRQSLPEQRSPSGAFLLPVAVTPAWGLSSTQTWVIGEALGRPQSTLYENGDSVVVREWFEGGSLARISEALDRQGRVQHRFVRELNSGSESSIPYDLTRHYRVSPWGGLGLADEEAWVRGTDLPLFRHAGDDKIYFDLSRTYHAPLYAIDPARRDGILLAVAGTTASNVVAFFKAELSGAHGANAVPSESTLNLLTLHFRGLFNHRVSHKAFDRAGHLVSETIGRISSLGQQRYTDASILGAAARFTPIKTVAYHYDPGWFVEQIDPQTQIKTLVFSTNNVSSGTGLALAVNQGAWREFPTRIDSVQLASANPLDTTATFQSQSKRSHSPAWLEANPHLPRQTNTWIRWTATEFDHARNRLFDTETIYDAAGEPSVIKTLKTTASGRPAAKLTYRLPRLHSGTFHPQIVAGGEQSLPVDLGGQNDFTGSDYVFLYVENAPSAPWQLIFTDRANRTARVSAATADHAGEDIAWWAVGDWNVRWMPNQADPRHAASVTAPASLTTPERAFVVAVHDLARSGLNIREIQSCRLAVAAESPLSVSLSPLYHLARNGAFPAEDAEAQSVFETQPHASGLVAYSRAEAGRDVREVYSSQRLRAAVELHGLPIAATHDRGQYRAFPPLVILDNSEPDAPRPLYAISSENSNFLEHYEMLRFGGVQIYTVVQGFDLPRFEVFEPSVLGDEVSPGYIAYGYDYHVTVKYAKGSGLISRWLANVHNRVVANVFKTYGSDQLIGLLSAEDSQREQLRRYHYELLHHARLQADRIRELPMVAAGLLPVRAPPWQNPAAALPANAWAVDQARLATNLLGLHVTKHGTNLTRTYEGTYLIPTAPETRIERYVDTVEEADLIALAVELGEHGMAGQLLEFYWRRSGGGTKLLHSSYDALTGTAMAPDFMFERPVQAKPTAEAQIAMAEAAFRLGYETGNANWINFGRSLTTNWLARFRPREPREQQARGVAEAPVLTPRQYYGLTLWPEAERYNLRSNAKAYLLLRNIERALEHASDDPRWQSDVRKAREEQEAWLRERILPHVMQSGVVPKGLFQIQDINQGTTAMGLERWTGAKEWLLFLEAAHHLGVAPEQTHAWLDNLSRVHGVSVSGQWGLDWNLPLLRPDAISPQLTAHLWRVAKLLGHQPAEQFAFRSLASMAASNALPSVVTTASTNLPLLTGQGHSIFPSTNQAGWPDAPGAFKELLEAPWTVSAANPAIPPLDVSNGARQTDLTVFILLTALFYLSILTTSAFWWHFRGLRSREAESDAAVTTQLVPDAVMQRAEERWSKRVLGAQSPKEAECTRFSNATVEQNFLMQLRAIYKLVLEWRRQENEWSEDDPRLAEDESDEWLNGLDEFASFIGIYMRWVIKAGRKDGFSQKDFLSENEDSNHIWSRLVMYFAEFYWGMTTLMTNYNNQVTHQARAGLYSEISQLLRAMGLRQRTSAFDARVLFNYPANPSAMDLLIIQKPGMTLPKVLLDASMKLKIPYSHLEGFVEKYKAFKKRENPYPIHPYLIEFAKVLPHFLLMGLGALVWFNQGIGDSPIVPYLWSVFVQFVGDPGYLAMWAALAGSLLMNVLAYFVRIYRFEGSMLARDRPQMILDATVTSFFVKKHSAMPQAKSGLGWQPEVYERTGWALRVIGFLWLGVELLRLPAPSFATFLVVKGLFAMLALVEALAVILPLASTALSKYLQDRVSASPNAWPITRFLNSLNFTATRPASPWWLSIKYHNQPTVPSGTVWGMAQAIVFYFVLAASFFGVGAFLCQQIFSLWFTDTYLNAANWKLFVGGLLFWNTMYLLRYGLFLMFTGLAAFVAAFPVKGSFALLAVGYAVWLLIGKAFHFDGAVHPGLSFSVMGVALALILLDKPVTSVWSRLPFQQARRRRKEAEVQAKLQQIQREQTATLGVIYMGGDDLSYHKLTPNLLLSRWQILRDRLDSHSLPLLSQLAERPTDQALEEGFRLLYDLEKKCDVTLWHPAQISVRGGTPVLRPELGLGIEVESAAQRDQLLVAWHIRRWLVTMMSSAGHAQDTGVTLVDIALRLARDGLGFSTVFYLIQNKYDNNDNNRPVQTPYQKGELGHRNKLARLLMALAPGCRAYSIQNWTPFGFKAGGLTGIDLIHEESLKLTTMLVLDRNATVHDLDEFMRDIAEALTNPELVIIIPGRGTTNTLTSVGQGSQMVEEGHRSFLKGLMGWLGGTASEMVGTGWGNIVSVSYGRAQRAMIDSAWPKMPLTSRMMRGSSFAVRVEGLIGFAPHAVGISEDTWAVSQAAHNGVAFGQRVRFQVSRAFWHKIRETWSHSEWLASFPRWSGGFLQMMHDPLMQKINDFGPASVFCKEVRANSGRNFLSAPFALLNILLMPLAIMLDVTPFVQILIVLWNFGFIMNQILTVHGLNAYLESSGFYRLPAVLGAAAAGLGTLFAPEAWRPFAPSLILLGALYGGFIVGLNRWLYTRVRDVILFGPQLVLHTLGQLIRQSLEFVLSGASPEDAKGVNAAYRAWSGPREDRPLDRYPHFINLRTVVWVVGLLSVFLNVIALTNLDMLNVLLLLPSLLFSVSALVGPFIIRPRVGRPLGSWLVLPKALGWFAALVFYITVSLFVGLGAAWTWAGAILFLGVMVLLLARAGRYLFYHTRLAGIRRRFTQLLAGAGLAGADAAKLASTIVQQSSGDAAKVQAALNERAVPPERHPELLKLAQERLAPMLRQPVLDLQRGRFAQSQFASEWGRSFGLAMFVLLWFMVVPVPGLFVFRADEYRISMELGTIFRGVGATIVLVLGGFWLAQGVQWLDRRGFRRRSLQAQIETSFRSFQAMIQNPGQLSPQEVSSIYALFTDVKTYLDQRSYGYARRCIGLIQATLSAASARAPRTI